jgi:hypothetical protein
LPGKPDSSKCDDDTEPIVINIPCRLIERAQKYAVEHGNSVTGVVIEALDALLGGRTYSSGQFGVSNERNMRLPGKYNQDS